MALGDGPAQSALEGGGGLSFGVFLATHLNLMSLGKFPTSRGLVNTSFA